MNPLLSLSDLSFSYRPEKVLLRKIHLELHAGEVLWLAGRNGAGKSTLAKLIMGLLQQEEGRILLQGRDCSSSGIEERAGILGLALQNPDLQLFAPTLRKELAFGPQNLGASREDCRNRVDHVLDFFQLQALEEESPLMQTFSMRKIIALASVYAMDPSIYIMDEPDWSMDARGRELLNRLIAEERQKGKAFIIISHNPEYMCQLAQRILYLKEEGEWQMGPLKDLLYPQKSTDLIRLAERMPHHHPMTPGEWAADYQRWRSSFDR